MSRKPSFSQSNRRTINPTHFFHGVCFIFTLSTTFIVTSYARNGGVKRYLLTDYHSYKSNPHFMDGKLVQGYIKLVN